ncbi:MAG: hypothetical protein LBC59_09340 [Chitinispirillales bacterium]|jgi:hypothetical protein|nr:hypothetical protein [Chitinispirillales bacterium]
MLVAQNENKERCLAKEAKKGDSYYCPECGSKLTLKKGHVKIPHFAHKVKCDCCYGHGESETHYKIKTAVYDYLNSKTETCKNVALELYLKEVRPDVYAEINGVKVAIEIQKSNIDIDTIKKRMTAYKNKDIAVIWLIPNITERHETMRCGKLSKERLKPWERYLLGLYGMRLYLYTYSELDTDGTITECYLDNFWQCLKVNHKNLHLDHDFISKDFDGLISFDSCLIPCTVLPAKVYVRNNEITYAKGLMHKVTRPYIRYNARALSVTNATEIKFADFSYRDADIVSGILEVLNTLEGVLENYINAVTELIKTNLLPQNVSMRTQLNSYLIEEMKHISTSIDT